MKPILDHSIEAEQAVLGAFLIDSSTVDAVPEMKPGWFFLAAHQAIASAIVSLVAEKRAVDAVTVHQWLEARNKIPDDVPAGLVFDLARGLGTSTNVAHYARIVRGTWALRQARLLAVTFATNPDLLDATAALDAFQRDLGRLEAGRTLGDLVSAGEEMERLVSILSAESEKKPGTEMILSGFRELDRIIGGLQPGIFQLYAARPGVGKSAFATGLCRNLGRSGVPAAIFWQEDTPRMFAMRLAACEGGIPSLALRHGTNMKQQHWSMLMSAATTIQKWPLYVESTKGLTMGEVTQRMRRFVREKGVRVFIFDHLGRLRLTDVNGRLDMALGEAAGLFLEEAERLNACPIALHQLSKKAEEPDGTPSLGWLFNSDVLAQHARVVGYLARDDRGTSRSFDIAVIKATYAPAGGTAHLGWDPETMTVFDPVPPEVKQ